MSTLADLYDDEARAFGEIAERRERLCADAASLLAQASEVACDALLEGRAAEARAILRDAGVDADEIIDGLTRCDSAGVSVLGDDQAHVAGGAERERRRATLARAKAGVAPIARPEDVTYEDEPEEAVRVPLDFRLPGGVSWDYAPDMTLADIARAQIRAGEREREIGRWKAETACERETVPLEPEEP